jgi:probable F420-dependent oxidoreductase
VKFGLAFASSLAGDPQSSLDLCRRAEALGFESVWGGEHVIRPIELASKYPYTPDGKMPGENDDSIPDPLIWLAYVAAAAPSVRLGTCILILPQRNPVVLAKELATLDHLSGGRVELGIGVGWLEEEFNALGVPWERRGARTDDYLGALKALWAGPGAEYHGEFVDFAPVTCNPRPVGGSIPIMVGGDSPAAIRRAARHGDGFFPGTTDPADLEKKIVEVRRLAESYGRDPAAIEVSSIFGQQIADPARGAEQLAEIGVSRSMVPAMFFGGDGGTERFEQFAETVAGVMTR